MGRRKRSTHLQRLLSSSKEQEITINISIHGRICYLKQQKCYATSMHCITLHHKASVTCCMEHCTIILKLHVEYIVQCRKILPGV